MMRFVLFLCASLFLAGCASHSGDDLQPKTAGSVNLKRYQGTWYELARLPMYFQRNCAQSEARYTLLPDGDMSVFNRCLTTEWKWEEAEGTATPQVPGKTDKLWWNSTTGSRHCCRASPRAITGCCTSAMTTRPPSSAARAGAICGSCRARQRSVPILAKTC